MKKTLFFLMTGLFLLAGGVYAVALFPSDSQKSASEVSVPDKDPKSDCCKSSEKGDKKNCADKKSSCDKSKAKTSSCCSSAKASDCSKSKSTKSEDANAEKGAASASNCPKTKCQ